MDYMEWMLKKFILFLASMVAAELFSCKNQFKQFFDRTQKASFIILPKKREL